MIRSNPAAQVAAEYERRSPPANAEGSRFAGFSASTHDASARTVEAVLSAGSPVRRYGFTEELEISPEAVNLDRVASGQCRVLDSHNQWALDAVLGSVVSARIEGDRLIGLLRFADTEQGRKVEGMVARGELTGISIGYRVSAWRLVHIDDHGHETWRAASWELTEVSFVSVPADANAGVRSAVSSPGQPGAPADQEESDMIRSQPGGAPAPAQTQDAPVEAQRAAPAAAPAPSPAAPAAPVPETRAASAPAASETVSRFSMTAAVAFVENARSFGEGLATRATELVAQNERGEVTIEAARATILTEAAAAQRAASPSVPAGAGARAGQEGEGRRNAIVDALAARALRTQPTDAAREFMGMRLMEVAVDCAVQAGVRGFNARERNPDTILRAAHTTSDFPYILENVANRVLLARYNAAAPTYREIARQRNLRDFRPTKLLRIGDFPTLVQYQEDGEIKAGTVGEGRETVQLASYGRILRISRQALVNDDLGAFDDVFGGVGGVVSRFENATFMAMKGLNSGLGPVLADGHTVFKTNHANYTSSGTVLGVPSLGIGRAAMRKQKDLDGNVLNTPPAILFVGPDNETLADQLVTAISAVASDKVNPFSGRLRTVVEGSVEGYAWELYADPSVLPTFNWGYLDDAPGPQVMAQTEFNTDGMSFRVTLDFYAGAVDFRGGYRNAGSAS